MHAYCSRLTDELSRFDEYYCYHQLSVLIVKSAEDSVFEFLRVHFYMLLLKVVQLACDDSTNQKVLANELHFAFT